MKKTSTRIKRIYSIHFIILLAGVMLFANNSLFANTYTVNSTSDFPITGGVNSANGQIVGGAGAGLVTLRSAIAAANAIAGPHTINLGNGTYQLTIVGNASTGVQENNQAIGDLDLTRTGVTINGNGSSNTIIQQTTLHDRVLDVNPNFDAVFNFTLNDVTIKGGREHAGGIGSGGAIICGASTAGQLVLIQNCVFLDNQTSGAGTFGGGAIAHYGGNLTVTNCTFGGTNAGDPNTSSSSGGAIYFDALGTVCIFTCTNNIFTNNVANSAAAGGGGIDAASTNGGSGTVNVTGCSFSGNHANTAGGGAIMNESVILNVTKCTFLNNTAMFGGAVRTGGGSGTSVNFSRLFGNTASSSGNAFNGSVALNGDNNWWGVNTGPPAGSLTGSATATRWLQLKNTASTSPICVSGTSTITASFLTNNLSEVISAANLSALIGLPITFNSPANGSLSGAQATIQAAGTATVAFTATAAGNGSANAVFVPAVENFTVTTSPTITINNPSTAPGSITGTSTICNGNSTTLTATGGTLGTGANYQWGTGGTPGTSPIGGATNSTLNVSPASNTTYWVRIENTTAPCTGTTGGVTQLVTVNQPSVAPSSISGTTTICSGGNTTLTAVGGTLGTGANYQWGTGGTPGTNPIGGATNSTLNVSPAGNTTYWVRIENTTAPCTGNTSGVTQLVTIAPNNTSTLTSGAGSDAQVVPQYSAITPITYSTTGATGANFSGLPPGVTGNWVSNTATISGSPTAQGLYNYTVTLTGGCGTIMSNGSINVSPALPVNLVSFTAKLNSDNTVTLQWKVEAQQDILEYIVEESTDGISFRTLSSIASNNGAVATYSYIDMQVAMGKNYYRLKVVELSGKITYSNVVAVNLKEGVTVMLYPNPVTGQLTIQQFGTVQNKNAVLFDGQGKILLQINLDNLVQQINMEKYAAGVYILKMEDGTVFKVVKQ